MYEHVQNFYLFSSNIDIRNAICTVSATLMGFSANIIRK